MSPAIGEAAPAFELPDTEGDLHSLGGDGATEDAAATVVVFTCNHCPYALAWHDRLLAVARDYAGRGVRMLAINPNDAERYPRDSLEAMRERVRADGGWPVPYLRDEDQSVARAYEAKTTPDVFVVAPDGAIAYRGAPDADHGDPSLDAAWLRAALDRAAGEDVVERAETTPVGCSVKWRA
jgi:peroxiredoxin